MRNLVLFSFKVCLEALFVNSSHHFIIIYSAIVLIFARPTYIIQVGIIASVV